MPILKGRVRILTADEYEKIIKVIPKVEYRTKFEALLFSGLRYSEAQYLYTKPELFDGYTIHMVNTKPKCLHTDRYVHLNVYGRMSINYFLRCKTNLPSYVTWVQNLKRWAEKANISTEGLSVKTTRKTLESWLMITHPEKAFQVCLSQGHNELTSLRYYVNLPFTKEDKERIKKYVEGWGE